MAGFETGKIGDGAHDMAVFCDNHAVFNPVTQTVGGGFGHLPGSFARGYQQYPPRKLPAAEGTLHRRIRLYCRNGFADNPVRMAA